MTPEEPSAPVWQLLCNQISHQIRAQLHTLAHGCLKAHYPFPLPSFFFSGFPPPLFPFFLGFQLVLGTSSQQTHGEAEEEDVKWLGLVAPSSPH